jgi:hypothetical protein
VGSTGWSATFREILRYYINPELSSTVNASLLGAIEGIVIDSLNQDAEATQPILEEAGFPLTEDVAGWQGAYNGLLDLVKQSFEGNAGMQDRISSIQETTNEVVNQLTTQTRTEDVTTAITTDVTDVTRRTRFVDLPTADKLLDDFDAVMVEHADTLWRAGDIDRSTRDWMVQNPGFFWADFYSETIRRVRAGEDPFRVVGVEGPQVQVGSRPGEAVEQEITTLISQVDVGTLKVEDIIERTIERLTEQAGTQDSGVIDTDLRQTIMEEVTSVFKQFNMATQQTEAIRALTMMTIEEVIARPELDKVFAFSPTDFITGRFSPTELMNIAAAVPGREAAARQQPSGVAPSAPRRLA